MSFKDALRNAKKGGKGKPSGKKNPFMKGGKGAPDDAGNDQFANTGKKPNPFMKKKK